MLWTAPAIGGKVWRSDNGGVNWFEEDSFRSYSFIKCSKDGTKRVGFQ
jgi:hypothetical protein